MECHRDAAVQPHFLGTSKARVSSIVPKRRSSRRKEAPFQSGEEMEPPCVGCYGFFNSLPIEGRANGCGGPKPQESRRKRSIPSNRKVRLHLCGRSISITTPPHRSTRRC